MASDSSEAKRGDWIVPLVGQPFEGLLGRVIEVGRPGEVFADFGPTTGAMWFYEPGYMSMSPRFIEKFMAIQAKALEGFGD